LTYEVRCHQCNVSFPPETKRCVHCGARTSAQPPPGARLVQVMEGAGEAPGSALERNRRAQEQGELEAEMEGRSPFRFGSTGLWIALALFAGIMRACFGG